MKRKPKPVTGKIVTRNNQQQNDASGIRLKEILGVLKKHHITSGIQPEKLRQILEDLGPTYVKLGQIMSMRSDILPDSYCKELERLRTDVKPLPFDVIKSEIEKELGKPADVFFKEISPEPLGSASIAQVYLAVLSNGEQVVIKVQRPQIHEIMEEDIKLMRRAVSLLKFTMGTGELIDFRTVIDELWKTSQEEMDFLKEAANCDTFFENQREIKYVTCPKVYHELTTSHIMVMDYIKGIQIDHIGELEEQGYDMTEAGSMLQNSVHILSLSILTASLFIGSSLLCLAPVNPLLLGIPWPAFVGFSIAGILFICLLFRIFFRHKSNTPP